MLEHTFLQLSCTTRNTQQPFSAHALSPHATPTECRNGLHDRRLYVPPMPLEIVYDAKEWWDTTRRLWLRNVLCRESKGLPPQPLTRYAAQRALLLHQELPPDPWGAKARRPASMSSNAAVPTTTSSVILPVCQASMMGSTKGKKTPGTRSTNRRRTSTAAHARLLRSNREEAACCHQDVLRSSKPSAGCCGLESPLWVGRTRH